MTRPAMDERARAGRAFEQRIGRLLVWATYLAVGLLLLGVLLMIRDGISPLDATPPLDVGSVLADALALEPTGFLWLGLAVVIATPISRVIVAAVAYARARDTLMVAVSLGILLVIVIGIATAVTGGPDPGRGIAVAGLRAARPRCVMSALGRAAGSVRARRYTRDTTSFRC